MSAARLAIASLALALGACATPPAEPPAEAPAPVEPVERVETIAPEPPAPPLPPIRVAAVGDIMMGTDYPDNRLPPDDGVGTFDAVRDVLASADLAIGNLEGVLADGVEPFKVCKNPALCYLFRTPGRYATYLAAAGFDAMSLANNHARDFGEEGRDATMTNLDAAGVAHSGREGDIASIDVAGRRVAFIGFAPNVGSYPLLEPDVAAALVTELSRTHDLVIVSFHGGAEGPDAVNVPHGGETYYGEDRGDLRAFSRAVIDAGADLVVGHGPHVPRGLEVYSERLIAYSLGNFATYFGISVQGIKGIAPILLVDLDSEGRFTGGEIVSTVQTRESGLTLDPTGAALALMARLSAEDFGAAAPVIDALGRLSPPPANGE